MHVKRNSRDLIIVAYSELFNFRDNTRLKDDERLAIMEEWFNDRGINVLTKFERDDPPPPRSYVPAVPNDIPQLSLSAGDWVNLHTYDHCLVVRRLTDAPVFVEENLTMSVYDIKPFSDILEELFLPALGPTDPTVPHKLFEVVLNTLMTTMLVTFGSSPTKRQWELYKEALVNHLGDSYPLTLQSESLCRMLVNNEPSIMKITKILHDMIQPIMKGQIHHHYHVANNCLHLVYPQTPDENNPTF